MTCVDGALAPVGGRFPLGQGTFDALTSDEPPSRLGVRPFGLRFATVVDRSGVEALPRWRWCPRRQMSVADEDPTQLWYLRFRMANGSMKSTGPSPDGQGSTGNEEWTPDYLGDATP